LIRDVVIKRKVLQMLESVARGIDRLEAVTKRLDPNMIESLLTKLHAPALGEVVDIKTLQQVVLGLEALAGSTQQQEKLRARHLLWKAEIKNSRVYLISHLGDRAGSPTSCGSRREAKTRSRRQIKS
jgi:hypothetical protein